MRNKTLKELKIKLPNDVSRSEIIAMLLDKAITKAEYYRSKCKEFEEKYTMDFSAFKKKVESAIEEKFSDWDDLIIWEGYELACNEWMKKIKELESCME